MNWNWREQRRWMRERAAPRDIDGTVRVSVGYASGSPLILFHPESTAADHRYVEEWLRRWTQPEIVWNWPARA